MREQRADLLQQARGLGLHAPVAPGRDALVESDQARGALHHLGQLGAAQARQKAKVSL